ncbi:unnamed protein product, partial [Staurois parvus]
MMIVCLEFFFIKALFLLSIAFLTLAKSHIGFIFILLNLLPLGINFAVCSHTVILKNSHFCVVFIDANIPSQFKSWRAALILGKFDLLKLSVFLFPVCACCLQRTL